MKAYRVCCNKSDESARSIMSQWLVLVFQRSSEGSGSLKPDPTYDLLECFVQCHTWILFCTYKCIVAIKVPSVGAARLITLQCFGVSAQLCGKWQFKTLPYFSCALMFGTKWYMLLISSWTVYVAIKVWVCSSDYVAVFWCFSAVGSGSLKPDPTLALLQCLVQCHIRI